MNGLAINAIIPTKNVSHVMSNKAAIMFKVRDIKYFPQLTFKILLYLVQASFNSRLLKTFSIKNLCNA